VKTGKYPSLTSDGVLFSGKIQPSKNQKLNNSKLHSLHQKVNIFSGLELPGSSCGLLAKKWLKTGGDIAANPKFDNICGGAC
jgi:hypothetical protein